MNPNDPGIQVNPMPATITFKNGTQFVVEGYDKWAYVAQGIFATGHFDGEETERDLLINPDEISYISLDYSSLKAQDVIEGNESPGA